MAMNMPQGLGPGDRRGGSIGGGGMGSPIAWVRHMAIDLLEAIGAIVAAWLLLSWIAISIPNFAWGAAYEKWLGTMIGNLITKGIWLGIGVTLVFALKAALHYKTTHRNLGQEQIVGVGIGVAIVLAVVFADHLFPHLAQGSLS